MPAYLVAQLPADALASPVYLVVPVDAQRGILGQGAHVGQAQLPAYIDGLASTDPESRWIWEDTRAIYPSLLAAGVRVQRCHDLGLSALILHGALPEAGTPLIPPRAAPEPPPLEKPQDALFAPLAAAPPVAAQLLADEYVRQLALTSQHGAQGRKLRFLMSLDSVGSLIAEEMRAEGVPWDRGVHEALLQERLGARVPHGTRPARVADLVETLQDLLDAPRLNPDSGPELLRALRQAGIDAPSTRRWDLEEIKHPVIEPLLKYKKLQRLASANGWAWLDAWVKNNRFHPEYLVAGVVTGRWASVGGGAMQIPHDVRSAVRASPGHALVVADASQLEPRVLAAMSADRALAEAARGQDLYQSIADRAFGGDRDMAKVAMLGAMYGGTTGPSAAMAPRLTSAYPRATAFLEEAARTGERGGTVHTWLGRTSPRPQPFGARPSGPGGEPDVPDDAPEASSGQGTGRGPASHTPAEGTPAVGPDPAAAARSWGRFTRNFVVQGTAAEWAECWMADLRGRLQRTAPGSRQVFFLHDEIMVHAPLAEVDAVRQAMVESAQTAAELLFGSIPVDFPVSVGVAQDYASAK